MKEDSEQIINYTLDMEGLGWILLWKLNFVIMGAEKKLGIRFKNGKWCCSNSKNSCETHRKKVGDSNKGKPSPMKNRTQSEESRRKISKSLMVKDPPIRIEELSKLCDSSCGQIAKFQFKNGKSYCCENPSCCPEKVKRSNKNKKEKGRYIINENNRICEYGCGQIAKFQLPSKKFCCEDFYMKCSEQRRKNKESNKKGKMALPFENTDNSLCDYGCGQIAKYKFKNGKKCCDIMDNFCPEKSIKIGKSNTGKVRTEEFKKNASEFRKGKPSGMKGKKQTEYSNEMGRQRMLNGLAKYISSFPRDPEKMRRSAEKSRQRLLNGGAKHMHSFPCRGYKNHQDWMINEGGRYLRSFIKDISRDEMKLRDLVKELYSTCEFQYPVLVYDLDVAIPEYKIAIEFDGYYHFDTEYHKEYHKMRQKRIEGEGWKFYRVTMFDKFPTLEEVKVNIQKLIREIENEATN